MVRSFKTMFVSLDAFGEKVSLNYQGESSYKTLVGAFLTLVLRAFMFVYAAQQILNLSNYNDPQILQVSTNSKLDLFFISDIVYCDRFESRKHLDESRWNKNQSSLCLVWSSLKKSNCTWSSIPHDQDGCELLEVSWIYNSYRVGGWSRKID